MKNKLWFTYAVLLFCVTAWGSNFVFGAILVEVFDPSIIALLRLVFILLFLFFVTFRAVKSQKLSVRDYVFLAISGFVGVTLNQWSFYASLQFTEPVTAALILALSPIVTSLLSSYWFNERKTLRFWLGSLVALFGVWLVIANGSLLVPRIGKGELLILLTMVSFSVFLIFVQHLSKSIHPAVITWYSNVFGAIGLIPFIPWETASRIWTVTAPYWLLLIATAVIMHGLCTYLWNNSIRQVGASKAALLLNLEPFIAMVFSLIILGEGIQTLQLIGATVIVCGVAFSLRTNHREPE